MRIAACVCVQSGMAAAKLPPMPKKTLTSPRIIASSAATTLWPRARGGSKPNRAFEPVEQRVRGHLGDADRAVALHVGMAAHGADAGALAADIAAQQSEVGELLDVLRAVAVLGDAHAIDDDGALGLGIRHRRRTRRSRRGQAGPALDVVPAASRRRSASSASMPGGVAADEIPVEDRCRCSRRARGVVGLDQALHDALDERDVAADAT